MLVPTDTASALQHLRSADDRPKDLVLRKLSKMSWELFQADAARAESREPKGNLQEECSASRQSSQDRAMLAPS